MQRLAGKVGVVTGGASGIGLGIARALAAEGASVALADIEAEPLAKAEASLAADGADVVAVRTDVSDGGSVEALRDAVEERFGTWHVVCNNAGVSGARGPIWELTESAWRWTMGVNLWGVLHGIRTFVPRLVEQKEGHVVNTASIFGHLTGPMISPYYATKHAVVALSETLAIDLQMNGCGVGASVLCPGLVNTNILDSGRHRPDDVREDQVTGSGAEREIARQFFGTGMDPDEVGRLVVDAVKQDRFWIFSHPHMLDAVTARTTSIVEQRNPHFQGFSLG